MRNNHGMKRVSGATYVTVHDSQCTDSAVQRIPFMHYCLRRFLSEFNTRDDIHLRSFRGRYSQAIGRLILTKTLTIMASNLVLSEFLCFTLTKVGKSPAKNVKAVLLDFYNEDEIWSAKALLHGELSKVTSDELPRLVHRKGDNRARLDVDDLFTLLAHADELNVHSFQPLLQLSQTKCHT